jgi:hypothetical protein
VFVPAVAAAGSTVMVWVNQAGQLTDSPLQHSQVAGRAGLSEAPAARLGRGMASHRTPVELPPVARALSLPD